MGKSKKHRNVKFRKRRNDLDAFGNSGMKVLPKNDRFITDRHSSRFEIFYQTQGFIPEEEWELFLKHLASDLPQSFRFVGNLKEGTVALQIFKEKFLSQVTRCTVENEDVIVNIREINWYPNGLAFEINLPKKTLRRQTELQSLHNFLVVETACGILSRQEAVSMIPPLFMDIKSHHSILDMCASPGSKTVQLIEMLHADGEALPSGFIIANDLNNERCYLLVHQSLRRSGSPCCVITNCDASQFPDVFMPDKFGKLTKLKFDRILCDVPCSSDGTMRKNLNLWKEWHVNHAYALHKLQRKIVERGLHLLATGGLLVYSTCSMNPAEDEAVITQILIYSQGMHINEIEKNENIIYFIRRAVELVDVGNQLPELVRCKGFHHWKVLDAEGNVYSSPDEVPDYMKCKIHDGLFPPDKGLAEKLHLERCLRIFPHHQNTGGFFIAVLRKVCEFSWSTGKEAEVLVPSGQDLKSSSEKKRRYGGFKEDPFIFVDGDNNSELIQEYFGMDDRFSKFSLLMRQKEVSKKGNIYLVNENIKHFIKSNEHRIKIINAGLRTFSRCSVSNSVQDDFRLVQDGLRYVIPLMSKRLVNISKDELLKLIKSKESILLKDLSDELHSQLDQIGEGSVALVHGAEDAKCSLQVASWLGKCSIAPHLDKENRAHFLFMLDDLQAAYDMYKGNETDGVDKNLEAVIISIAVCKKKDDEVEYLLSLQLKKAQIYYIDTIEEVMSRKVTPPGSLVSADSVTAIKPLSRALQVAVVIDLLIKDGLSIRQLVWDELQKLDESTNMNMQYIPFEKLDFGEISSLDMFYNADLAIVDVSVSSQRTTLCYHLGVRESMHQDYNIVLCSFEEKRQPMSFMFMVNLYFFSVFLCLRLSVFKVPFNNYKPLICTTSENALIAVECSQFFPGMSSSAILASGNNSSFRTKIKKLLKDVQIDATAHVKEKFLADLRQARQKCEGGDLSVVLDRLRMRLDDPDVLSVDTVVNMLLSYRDIQNYNAMVSLVEDVSSLPYDKIHESPAVQFNYAFALNRRNKDKDRDKALSVTLDSLSSQENQVPDFLCLAGRIYKDKLAEYRKGFEIQPNEYAGINLATLLVIAGETFQTSSELQQIAVILSGLLGRKGSLQDLKDYWDVATFFEISVLAENYANSCQAAYHMFLLKPPAWFLKSTIGNIKLIKRFRETLNRSMPENQFEYQQFLFWMEFFVENTKSDEICTDTRFPVLTMEPSKMYIPSYVSVNEESKAISLWHVEDTNRKNLTQWIFPAESIRAVSAARRDERAVYLYVYLNSDDFMLFFPSDNHRKRFLQLVEEITCFEGTKLLASYAELQPVLYEYETDANDQRVVLGKGTFGTVYAGRDLNSQRTIAIKEVEIKNHEEVQPLMEEIQLHSTLVHPNIVQYLGCEVSDDNRIFRIFMEQVPGGSLSLLLRNKWGPLIDNETTIAYYARQILEGLNYLHSQKIVHRDIKGDNVLVNTYSGQCKISDFGTCKRLAGLNPIADTFTGLCSPVGTLQYMAPEVIDQGMRGYGAPADIWSFGCTMIEMASGKPPFVELGSPQAAIFKVGMFKAHPPIPEGLSNQAKQLIERCFEPDPNKRSTAVQLLVDPFFEQVRFRRIAKPALESGYRDSSRFYARSISCVNSQSDQKRESSRLSSSSLLALNELSDSSAIQERQPSSAGHDSAASKFFMLRKDSERRDTLATIMTEYENQVHFFYYYSIEKKNFFQIIELWLSSIGNGSNSDVAVSANILRTLLACMRKYIFDKDSTKVRTVADEIRCLISSGATSNTNIRLALYAFQDVMHYVLRQQRIKPHWMFALDNLIRSCVQCVVEMLLPDAVSNLSVQDSDGSSSYSSVESAKSPIVPSFGYNDFGFTSSLAKQLRKELKDYTAENQRLLGELLKLYTCYQKLLRPLTEHVEQKLAATTNTTTTTTSSSTKCANSNSSSIGISAKKAEEQQQMMMSRRNSAPATASLIAAETRKCSLIVEEESIPCGVESSSSLGSNSDDQQDNSSHDSIGAVKDSSSSTKNDTGSGVGADDGDDALVAWLKELNVDERSIAILTNHQYTLQDLMEMVTREELLYIGLKGGVCCRLWRSIISQRRSSAGGGGGGSSSSTTTTTTTTVAERRENNNQSN
ncbi:Mitogen-activated protein kinase kinase kinase 15 [Trichinella pseudospiralis]|uniref:Mitogen-activated protein kinase kinase kinase 15 n=1 Tax=Trichinella pseudospiralis TaxID=6337 RepID=A0A0V1K9K3_TRIPS|nr:Mitogen-activated protein kinase kinase kinase 15 [Trichinella pseudospiralis]KRZ43874.1 Mitogen-activated protein kinase kinase kinase 15 [Trichinella pseudospiralis]